VAGSGEYENADGIGTAASIHSPFSCDWDRASDVKPFKFLYITVYDAVRRLNVKTGQMTTVKCSGDIYPRGIVCLSGSGVIVLSCYQNLWTIDPRTDTTERLAGALQHESTSSFDSKSTEWDDPFSVCFRGAYGMAWQERDQSILVADCHGHRILRVPVPDRLVVVRPASSQSTRSCVVG
jgi:hypothetical protein